MSQQEFDSFAPGSNMKEDFDGTIRSCTFERTENNQNFSAHFIIDADDKDEVEVFCGLGGDWQSYDGGASVEHPKGEHRKFNAQTAYSEWMVFAAGGFKGDTSDATARPEKPNSETGAAAVLREKDRESGQRAAQIGSTWDGLRFHFDVVKRPGRERVVVGKDDEGKDVVEWKDIVRDRQLPIRFLGIASGDPTASSSAPAATESAPAPSNAAAPAAGETNPAPGSGGAMNHPALADLQPADRIKIIQLAKTSDFGLFVDGVMGLTTQAGTPMLEEAKVIQALADEGFYNALRS